MTIRLLGTGAADGIPALYSESELSRFAREHGGKDVRTRAAAVVDDTLKIDFGPDTLAQIQRERLDARDWSAVIFTHSDADHLAMSELQYALFPFNGFEYAGFTIYANPTICAMIEEAYPLWPFELQRTRSFECFRHAEYTITPIRAFHKPDEDAHNLIVSDGSSTFLYATDTGIWEEPTWSYLDGVRLDGLIIECTDGFAPTMYDGHLDLRECVDVVTKLREMGTLKPGAPVVTTHHSHNGFATHAQLEEALAPHGIAPGYDGMVVTVKPL